MHEDEIVNNSETQDKGNKEVVKDNEVLFGLMSIAMPLINTLIWFTAASVRQISFDNLINEYDVLSQILAIKSSYNDNSAPYEKIKATLGKYHSDNVDGNNKCFTSDHWTNPGKPPAFASWVGSSIRKLIPSFGFNTKDLTTCKSGSTLTNTRIGDSRSAVRHR